MPWTERVALALTLAIIALWIVSLFWPRLA